MLTMAKRAGKLKREEQDLPPKIQQALVLRASGANWMQAAEAVGISAANLREWRKHPDADGFLQEAINENIGQAHSKFADAAPRLAERLIELGLDPHVKPYAQIQAIAESFRVLQTGVIDRENREQLNAIRESLEALEGNGPKVIDV